MKFSDFDTSCMRLALEEAAKAFGKTYPNPIVGAVLARNGKVLSSGYHVCAGTDHAEIVVLKKVEKKSRGATLYVTLEPCAFYGRTPPCVNAIVNAGIERVVFAMKDPNDLKNVGEKLLKEHDIIVEGGLLEDQARMQNQIFLKNVLKKMPYVVSKVAMTLDGKIASGSGDSRGISSKESLRFVHELRRDHQAILVGVSTVLRDDPHLGVRYVDSIDSPEPLRVILDSNLRSHLRSKVFRNKNVIVFASSKATKKKLALFEKKKIRVVVLKKVEPCEVLKSLFSDGVCSVFIEGGSRVLTSFWEDRCIDRYVTFITPKLAGGIAALTPLSGRGTKLVKDFDVLKNVSLQQFGVDFAVNGFLKIY